MFDFHLSRFLYSSTAKGFLLDSIKKSLHNNETREKIKILRGFLMSGSQSNIVDVVAIQLITVPQICQNLFLVTIEMVAVFLGAYCQFCRTSASYSVLQIRVSQLIGNCKAKFQVYESCRKHVKNQLGSNRALLWNGVQGEGV